MGVKVEMDYHDISAVIRSEALRITEGFEKMSYNDLVRSLDRLTRLKEPLEKAWSQRHG